MTPEPLPSVIPADSAAEGPLDLARELVALRPVMAAYVSSLLPGARDEVDDVVQKSCLAIWRKREEFRPGTNLKAWALRIAWFEVQSVRRDKARSRVTPLSDHILETLADSAAAATEGMDLRVAALRTCIEHLPARDREIVDTKYYRKEEIASFARSANLPPGRLQRALSRIRVVLKYCIERKLRHE